MKYRFLPLILSISLLAVGCDSTTGTLGGAAIGAVAGSGVGYAFGKSGGAVAGGAIGGLAGGAIGHHVTSEKSGNGGKFRDSYELDSRYLSRQRLELGFERERRSLEAELERLIMKRRKLEQEANAFKQWESIGN